MALFASTRIARLLGLSTVAFPLFPLANGLCPLSQRSSILLTRSYYSPSSRSITAGILHRAAGTLESHQQCRPSFSIEHKRKTGTRLFSDTIMSSLSLPNNIQKPAKIISLSIATDPNNDPLHKDPLPAGAELLQIGATLSDFDLPLLQQQQVNTVFVSHPQAREPLAQLLQALPSIEWIHTRSAGIDFCHSSALVTWKNGIMTNAKGQFSSTLAEYTLAACSYFAKDFARLRQSQHDKNWDPYPVQELRGATMGIVGYGDIGRTTAKLAKAYGMKVVGLRRRRPAAAADEYADEYADEMLDASNASFHKVFAESDYILCAMPLTSATRGMIGAELLAVAKKGSVFINVGRGPVVDEEALIAALQLDNNSRRLKGAALDVFAVEPLPLASPLWELDNVLLSPHNMDMTQTFMYDSTKWFVTEQIPRFVRGEPLLNPVDRAAGY